MINIYLALINKCTYRHCVLQSFNVLLYKLCNYSVTHAHLTHWLRFKLIKDTPSSTYPRLMHLGEYPSPSRRAVQMISQAREVCNVSPSALVFSRVCTIMFIPGNETPHNSIRDDCTSAKKSPPRLKNNINGEVSIRKNKCK
jgi:hypothetical protein